MKASCVPDTVPYVYYRTGLVVSNGSDIQILAWSSLFMNECAEIKLSYFGHQILNEQ